MHNDIWSPRSQTAAAAVLSGLIARCEHCSAGVTWAGGGHRLDESHLTGEAGEVGKSPEAAPLLYSGSKVGPRLPASALPP